MAKEMVQQFQSQKILHKSTKDRKKIKPTSNEKKQDQQARLGAPTIEKIGKPCEYHEHHHVT